MYVGPRHGRLGELPARAQPVESTASASRSRFPATLGSIPPGPAGTKATLAIMRDLVRASVRNPEQVIRMKALSLVRDLPPRQWLGQIRALHAFVRDQIRYVKDPVDVELVQTPESTLEIGQGDCDDKSTLLGALLTAIGHPSQFVAIGFDKQNFSHVLVETRVSEGWMPLETIIDKPAGWYPDDVQMEYRRSI